MKCLNWKVIAAAAAVALGLWGLAPGLAAAAGPLLVLAVCPLSMLLMMRAMSSMRSTKAATDEVAARRGGSTTIYVPTNGGGTGQERYRGGTR